MATFCPKHGSSTKAVLPESENPAGRRRRDVPAILKPSNFIWGGDGLGHQLTYLAGEGGFINQELPLCMLACAEAAYRRVVMNRWLRSWGRLRQPNSLCVGGNTEKHD